MTQNMATNADPAKIAAIAAAVQAYLDGEIRGNQLQSPTLSEWRAAALPVGNDVFALRRRTWTGRDQA
jgi:hypothetical protein